MSDEPTPPTELSPQASKDLDRYGRDLTGFTARERLFIAEYPKDWNASAAAIRAGYSAHSASDIGYELRHKPKIADAIASYLATQEDKAFIDRKWVLARLVKVEAEAATISEDSSAGPGPKAAARLHRLKAIELIGRHVDVAAFRTQLGISGPDGSPLWDLSRLTDEELDQFERLLSKVSVIRSDQVRTDDEATAPSE